MSDRLSVPPGTDAFPLCVDLDGTLVKTDLLWESLLSSARRRPWVLLSLVFWVVRGRASLKYHLAELADIDFAMLPYREEVVAFVRDRRRKGQRIFLTTASTERLATGVADALDVFDGVIASDRERNLKGTTKARVLADKFGHRGFDYVGDSDADVPVWEAARKAFLAGAPDRPVTRTANWRAIERIAAANAPNPRARAMIRALRPHQWAKNTLVLVPLLAAHRVAEISSLTSALMAFAAFCLCASSAYVLNDLLDLDADRSHPRKKMRPFASGDLPLLAGMFASPALLLAGAGIALLLPPAFQAALALYYVGTILYSTVLKQRVMIDVIALAGLYTARILGGGYAIGAPVSFWLLGFSMFVFLSLALVKRYTEFFAHEKVRGGWMSGRGYAPDDKPVVLGLGTASGMVAVLVLALYVNSDSVSALYRSPERLWVLCPLMLYWIGRIWMVAGRGKMHDDPVVYAARDRISYVVAAMLVVAVWLAT